MHYKARNYKKRVQTKNRGFHGHLGYLNTFALTLLILTNDTDQKYKLYPIGLALSTVTWDNPRQGQEAMEASS